MNNPDFQKLWTAFDELRTFLDDRRTSEGTMMDSRKTTHDSMVINFNDIIG